MPNFIMFVRANDGNEGPQSPPPLPPSSVLTGELAKINTFTSSMAIAGVLVSGDGFSESSKGARVHFSSSAAPTVTHGPFDAPSPVSGHWIIKTDTLDDAIEWAKKMRPSGETTRSSRFARFAPSKNLGFCEQKWYCKGAMT